MVAGDLNDVRGYVLKQTYISTVIKRKLLKSEAAFGIFQGSWMTIHSIFDKQFLVSPMQKPSHWVHMIRHMRL